MIELSRIRLVVADVDGTLTDGSMYYGATGEVLKRFSTYDGVAVELLRNRGILTALITAENSTIVTARASKLGITHVILGSKQKDSDFLKLCCEVGVQPVEVAYVGDDIGDLPAMRLAGVKVAVANASLGVRSIADILLETRGGDGALREFVEMIEAAHTEKT